MAADRVRIKVELEVLPEYLEPIKAEMIGFIDSIRHEYGISDAFPKFVRTVDRRHAERIPIFVFGSNLAGRHGKGAALIARNTYGAIYGQGVGLQGQSYAIPTKDAQLKVLPIPVIRGYVNEFIVFAQKHPEYVFNLTCVGCGLAGYSYGEMAPLFRSHSINVRIPQEWQQYM